MMYTNKPVKPTGMKAMPKAKATGKTTGGIGPKIKDSKTKPSAKNKMPYVIGKSKPVAKNTMPGGKMGSMKKVLR